MNDQPFRVLGDEVDLEREEVEDSTGRRVDAAYIERVVADVHARTPRPPLSGAPPDPTESACWSD